MIQKLHKRAKTNYYLRDQIRTSNLSIRSLAKSLKLNPKTVLKWKRRSDVSDTSSRPLHLRTELTQEQEEYIVYERKAHKKSLFEIWDTLNEHIPNLYTMKIYRVLSRWGLSVLPKEYLNAERAIRKFKKYGIGFLHIDLIYTPFLLSSVSDSNTTPRKKRYYVFSCIDRVSKLAYVQVTDKRTYASSMSFLRHVIEYYPYKINYILTDNGSEFTNKWYRRNKSAKIHPFTQLCKQNGIQHRTTKIKHPWTNGMVERFNQKIKKNVMRRYLFENVKELEVKLTSYLNEYNFNIKLQGLIGLSPVQYLLKHQSHKLLSVPQRIVT